MTAEGTWQGAACTRLVPEVQGACQFTATQKPKMGNSKQAQSSKAVNKKAHSCFIQTVLVVGELKGTTEMSPRLGYQSVSSDYLCINPMKQGAFLCGVGGLLGLLSHQSAGHQCFWTHFPSAKCLCSSQGCSPSLVLWQSGTLTPHGGGNKSHPLLGEKDETTSSERSLDLE